MFFISSTAYAATAQLRGEIGAMVTDPDPIEKLVERTIRLNGHA